MRFYHLLSRLFPRSFTAKVLLVAFIGTHIPLVGAVSYALIKAGGLLAHSDVLAVVLAATLAGCGLTILGLTALLAPVRSTSRALATLEAKGKSVRLPEDYGDELGRLMRSTNLMARHLGARLTMAEEAATKDALTGILNRRGFLASVPAQPVGAILYMDLDHFKRVNDTFGHEEGDRVLRAAAAALNRALRAEDLLARFGGEEFLVWLPGLSAAAAATIAERMRRAVADTVRAGDRAVTASIGVADGDGTAEVRDVISRADGALYAAKAAGRNRVMLYGEDATIAA